MSMDFNFFMNDVVNQARQEIVSAGYKELKTPAEVEEALEQKGTTLVMINSVCGCAGGVARPAAAHAVHYDKRPDHLVTVFAGQDKEATAKMREYFEGIEPSSPSIALIDGKKVVHFIPRHDIEGNSMENVMDNLTAAFSKYC